jgi:hypothetical protein
VVIYYLLGGLSGAVRLLKRISVVYSLVEASLVI